MNGQSFGNYLSSAIGGSLSSALSGSYQQYPLQPGQRIGQAQPPVFSHPVCLHGSECQLCEEETIKRIECVKEQNRIREQKKEDYKKRCVEYMERFRYG